MKGAALSRTSLFSFFSLIFAFSIGLMAENSLSKGQENIISGEFELLDHTGQAVSKASYNGKFRLVFFGFTNCPDVCPTTMSHVAKVMKLLGNKSQQVQPLFITIDHRSDTVDRIAPYVEAFHPSITGLTGTEEEIRNAAAGFSVNYGLGSDTTSGSVDEFYHSSFLYLMDKEGEFIDLFGYGTKAQVIASKLNYYLD